MSLFLAMWTYAMFRWGQDVRAHVEAIKDHLKDPAKHPLGVTDPGDPPPPPWVK